MRTLFEPLSHTISLIHFLSFSFFFPLLNYVFFQVEFFVSNEIACNRRALILQRKASGCCVGQNKSYLSQMLFANFVFSLKNVLNYLAVPCKIMKYSISLFYCVHFSSRLFIFFSISLRFLPALVYLL